MTKILKISVISLSILLVLVVLAATLLSSIVNTTSFKERVIQAVLEQTGQTLTIEGELSLSVFPWLGFKTGKISLSQPAGIDAPPLVEVDAAEIGVKLLPLLQKKIEAGNIELKQPQLYYVETSDGKTSFDTFTPKSTAAPSNSKGISPQKNQYAFSAIAVTGIKLTNGKLVYDNQKENVRHVIDELTIETGNLLSQQKTPFVVSARLKPDADSLFTAQTTGNVQLDIKSQDLAIDDINIDIKGKALTLSSTIESILFNVKNQTLTIQSMVIDSRLEKLNPVLSLPSIAIDFRKKSTSKASFSINEKPSNIQLSGNFLAKDWHKNPIVKGRIESNKIEPLTLAEQFGVTYTPNAPSALKTLSFSSHFSGTPNGFSLHSMNTTLDTTTITGDGSIVNFDDPTYRFDLHIDSINLDQYLPKPEAGSEEKETAKAGLAIAAPIPLFRGVSASGMVRAEKIQASGAKLSNLIVNIKSNKDQVMIKPSAQLYGGKTKGTITFSGNEQQANIAINNKLNNVNIEPLLKDTGTSDQLSGIANIQLDITALEKDNQQKNKGTINIAIKEGAIKGIDIKKILDNTQDKLDELRGKSIQKETGAHDDKTRFADMTATLYLKNNVITNKDLNIKAPAFRIGGKGKIELEPQKIDYLSDITLVNTNEGQGGKDRSNLKGAVIPVHFYGDIRAPEYKVDTRALIKKNTEKAVDKKKEELKEKLKEKLFEELFK